MFVVGDGSLVFALAVALVAVLATQISARDVAFLQVDLMVEFQGVFIPHSIPYLAELRVIDMKGADHLRVAASRTFARLDLQVGDGGGGGKRMRIDARPYFT